MPSRPHRIEAISSRWPAAMEKKEAAAYVGLGISVFEQMRGRGLIRSKKHPGTKKFIYLRDDLDEYLSGLPYASGEPLGEGAK